jgi:tyrosyl-tRNA synthetase
VTDNGVLSFCKMVLFPLSRDGRLTIARDAKFGGPLTYASYEQMEEDYLNKKLFPLDLKLVRPPSLA